VVLPSVVHLRNHVVQHVDRVGVGLSVLVRPQLVYLLVGGRGEVVATRVNRGGFEQQLEGV
jgi:hypothetical protein